MNNYNIKQNYILNEKVEAENIINSKTISPNVYKAIELIAKYFRIEKDMKKADIENYIIDFLADNYDQFHIVQTPELVESVVGKDWRRKNDYKIIESIKIMESELAHIRSVDNMILEKIMFVMLVDAKKNNISSGGSSGKWTSRRLEDLLKDAKLHGTYERKFLHVCKIEGIDRIGIISNKRVDANSYEVLFSDISYNGDVAFEMTDMREYVLEYLKWRGEAIGVCEKCGVRIEMLGNRTIYCKDCWESVRKEQNREKSLRYYRKGQNFTI